MARNRQRNRTRRPLPRPGSPLPGVIDDGAGLPPIQDDPVAAFDDGDEDGGGEDERAAAPAAASAAFGRAEAEPPRPSLATSSRTISFLRNCWAELQRVQWPDRQQVAQATGVVLGFVVAVFLGVADYLAGKLINAIL